MFPRFVWVSQVFIVSFPWSALSLIPLGMSVGKTFPRSYALPFQNRAMSVNDSIGRWFVIDPTSTLLSSVLVNSALIGGLAGSMGAVHWALNALVVHTWIGTPSSPLAYRSRFGSAGSVIDWYR